MGHRRTEIVSSTPNRESDAAPVRNRFASQWPARRTRLPRDWIRIVGLWQIVGGILSAAVFLDGLASSEIPPDLRLVLSILIVAVCLVSVMAGRALLLRRSVGKNPSIAIQCLQAVGIGTSELAYRLSLGPYLYIFISGNGAGLHTGFSPQLYLHLTASPLPEHLLLNVLALFFIIQLLRWKATYGTPKESVGPRPVGPST